MLPVLPDLGSRSRRPELMDEVDLEPERHVRALRALARINAVSRSAARIWSELERLEAAGQSLRVLDVACGGGDVLLRLARRARDEGRQMELEGCDTSAVAVAHARAEAESLGLDARFFRRDVLEAGLPTGYDVFCSSLFLHHLEESRAVSLLGDMSRKARRLVVVQDLRRTRFGDLLAWLGTRTLTRSGVARTDGPRSVQAAFTLDEVRGLARRAGMDEARLSPCWPQRFLLVWRPT